MCAAQTSLFRQDAVSFTRLLSVSNRVTGGYTDGGCTDFSLHRADTDAVLFSAQCSTPRTSTVGTHLPRCIAGETHVLLLSAAAQVRSNDMHVFVRRALNRKQLLLKVVLFGTGTAAGFPFGKNFVALKSTALSQTAEGISHRYSSIGGAYGARAVTAVVERFGQNLTPARTVERITFPAAPAKFGNATIDSKFALLSRTSYGSSVVIVP